MSVIHEQTYSSRRPVITSQDISAILSSSQHRTATTIPVPTPSPSPFPSPSPSPALVMSPPCGSPRPSSASTPTAPVAPVETKRGREEPLEPDDEKYTSCYGPSICLTYSMFEIPLLIITGKPYIRGPSRISLRFAIPDTFSLSAEDFF